MLLWRLNRFGFLLIALLSSSPLSAQLRIGTALIDVSPTQFPVLVNGGMTSREAGSIKAPVFARAIVLDDGHETVGIVVVDSCMMPRDLLDEAKHLAAAKTKLKPANILISATHTHTAPSCMGALGTAATKIMCRSCGRNWQSLSLPHHRKWNRPRLAGRQETPPRIRRFASGFDVPIASMSIRSATLR